MSTSPANEYFRTLLDASPDAMLVTDGDGVIVLVNTMALTLFGYRPGELEGHRIEVLIPKRYRGGHAAARARFEEEAAPRRMGERGELVALRQDGSEFHADISLSRCCLDHGGFTLVAVRDLTGRDRLVRERDELREELLAARARVRALEARVAECPRCGDA